MRISGFFFGFGLEAWAPGWHKDSDDAHSNLWLANTIVCVSGGSGMRGGGQGGVFRAWPPWHLAEIVVSFRG